MKIFALCILLFSGCSIMRTMDAMSGIIRKPSEKQRLQYASENPSLPDDIKQAIKEGRVIVGMTSEQIKASYGEPCNSDIYEGKETWTMFYTYGYRGSNMQFADQCYGETIMFDESVKVTVIKR